MYVFPGNVFLTAGVDDFIGTGEYPDGVVPGSGGDNSDGGNNGGDYGGDNQKVVTFNKYGDMVY